MISSIKKDKSKVEISTNHVKLWKWGCSVWGHSSKQLTRSLGEKGGGEDVRREGGMLASVQSEPSILSTMPHPPILCIPPPPVPPMMDWRWASAMSWYATVMGLRASDDNSCMAVSASTLKRCVVRREVETGCIINFPQATNKDKKPSKVYYRLSLRIYK